MDKWIIQIYNTIHRGITPKGAKEQYSFPLFFEPNFDALIECLETCCMQVENGRATLAEYVHINSC